MPRFSLPSAVSRPAAYAVGLFASKAIALIMLPVIANHLSVHQFGQLELYTSSSVFLSLLLGLALHEALYRFAGQESQADKQAVIAGQIVTLAGVVAVIALTLLLSGLFIASQIMTELPSHHLALLAIGVSSEGMISLLLAWLRMQDRAGDFIRVTLSVCVLQVLLVLTCLWLSPGVTGILAASVVAHIVQLLWLKKLCQLPVQSASFKRIKEFVSYSIPIALAGFLAFLMNGAERWIIAANDSIETLARYGIAAKFALALCILVQPFGMWWMPKRFAVLNHQGIADATRITQYGLVLIALLCSFMAYFAPLFITTVLPASYHAAAQLVLICLVAAALKEITELVNLGLLANKQTALLLRFNLIAAAVAAVGMLVLLPFGIWGIISALIIAQLIKLALVLQSSQKLLPLPYAFAPLISVFLLAAGHLLVSAYIAETNLLIIMALIAPLSVAVVAALSGLLPFSLSLPVQMAAGHGAVKPQDNP